MIVGILQAQNSYFGFVEDSLVLEIDEFLSPINPKEVYLIPSQLDSVYRGKCDWVILMTNPTRNLRGACALEIAPHGQQIRDHFNNWFKELKIREGFDQNKIYVLVNENRVVRGRRKIYGFRFTL